MIRKTTGSWAHITKQFTDEILHNEDLAYLTSEERDQIRDLFDQGVKHKMKMNFVRQMSKTSGMTT